MPRRAAFESNPGYRLLAAQQDRVLSRRQLAAVGVTGHNLASRLASGLWQDLGPYVVVLHSGPLSRPSSSGPRCCTADPQRCWLARLQPRRTA